MVELLGENVSGLSPRDAALRVAVAFKKLLEDLDMPVSLSSLGAWKEQIPDLADRVFKSPRHVASNPRKVRREDIGKLFAKALEGMLSTDS